MKTMMCAIVVLITLATAATADSTPGQETVIAGWATWYSRESCRREGTGGRRILMANTRPLIDSHLTCALPTNITAVLSVKFGQRIHVTNLENGRTALLTFTDRGPGRKSRSRGTIIDLTPSAFLAIGGKLEDGRIRIKLQVLK